MWLPRLTDALDKYRIDKILGSRYPPYSVSPSSIRYANLYLYPLVHQVKKETWLKSVLGKQLPPRPFPVPGSEGESKVDLVSNTADLLTQIMHARQPE